MRRALATATALAILLSGTAASARAVAVLPIATHGAQPAEARQVAAALAEMLAERGHDVLDPDQTARQIEQARPGCLGSARPECAAEAALALGRDTLVRGSLSRDPTTRDLTLELEALDTRTVQVIAESSHRTVGAEQDELPALARAVATSLLDRLPAPARSAHLVCASDPPGAQVQVNGVDVGQTPWEGEVPEGPALVLVTMEDRAPETRHLTLAAGEVQTIQIALVAPPEESAGTTRGPHRFDLVDGLLGSAALVGILGGSLVAIASVVPGTVCDSPIRDPAGHCAYVRQPANLWPVAAVITAGAAAGVAMGLRFLLGETVPVRARGETVGLEGHF